VNTETVDFYDGLAADYHLVWGDRWDEAVTRQGMALARLIRGARPNALTVLDCSCGIGTQAIGLAREGFRVTGTDISDVSIARARAEAARLDADVEFGVADFRDLREVSGRFDVVLSADNALPHLLDDADLVQALTAMRSRLRSGGLLIATMRDYDEALAERPPTTAPLLIAGPPRTVIVRLHDWDTPTSALYTVRFLICTENAEGEWSVKEHSARYRAITRQAFTDLLQQTGFADTQWRTGPEAGFHQPVVVATAP
jgi:glycine/sarcosine N-methyltransferase